jgi:hypothetical protein
VELLKDSGQIKLAVLSNCPRHHLIWQRSWHDRLSFSICSYRHNRISIANNHEEVVMTSILKWQAIKISSAPSLHCSVKLLDADAWLCTIESKFALLTIPCADSSKAHFAAQQLRGAARIWWDNHCAMQPAGYVISWEEFRTTFRAHHIPEGLMEWKLNEFLALTRHPHCTPICTDF